ncbi:hypothetical protein O6H91_12G067200 [Diphasiastrum complanatum]|uniref:Uncharacterized protein n=1 Tax=Diphasiastrum complanatum TaxID=34168 RepID=A0ACC2C2T7_DIPCM|nr:hypothetical protein O6H91_12G067200 [Diphasiastrum complanatum]
MKKVDFTIFSDVKIANDQTKENGDVEVGKPLMPQALKFLEGLKLRWILCPLCTVAMQRSQEDQELIPSPGEAKKSQCADREMPRKTQNYRRIYMRTCTALQLGVPQVVPHIEVP